MIGDLTKKYEATDLLYPVLFFSYVHWWYDQLLVVLSGMLYFFAPFKLFFFLLLWSLPATIHFWEM